MFSKPLYSGENSSHQIRQYIGDGEYSNFETKNSPFATPWGRAQEVTMFQRGLREVSAPKGSGFMVSRKLAEKALSHGAQSVGLTYGGYICFKEDGLATVLYYEFPEVARTMLAREITREELRNDLGDEDFNIYLRANGETVVETTTTTEELSSQTV